MTTANVSLEEAQRFWAELPPVANMANVRFNAEACLKGLVEQNIPPAYTGNLLYTIKGKLQEIKKQQPHGAAEVKALKKLFGARFQSVAVELAALDAAHNAGLTIEQFLSGKSLAKKLFNDNATKDAVLVALNSLQVRTIRELSNLLHNLDVISIIMLKTLEQLQTELKGYDDAAQEEQRAAITAALYNTLDQMDLSTDRGLQSASLFMPLYVGYMVYLLGQEATARATLLQNTIDAAGGSATNCYRSIMNLTVLTALHLPLACADNRPLNILAISIASHIADYKKIPMAEAEAWLPLLDRFGFTSYSTLLSLTGRFLEKHGNTPLTAFAKSIALKTILQVDYYNRLHKSAAFVLHGDESETALHLEAMLLETPPGTYTLMRSWPHNVILVNTADGIKAHRFIPEVAAADEQAAAPQRLPHEIEDLSREWQLTQPLGSMEEAVQAYVCQRLPAHLHTLRHDKEIAGAFAAEPLLDTLMLQLYQWSNEQRRLALPLVKELTGLDTADGIARFFAGYASDGALEYTAPDRLTYPRLTVDCVKEILKPQQEHLAQAVTELTGWSSLTLCDPVRLADQCRAEVTCWACPDGSLGTAPTRSLHRTMENAPEGAYALFQCDSTDTLQLAFRRKQNILSTPLLLTKAGFIVLNRCYTTYEAVKQALGLLHLIDGLTLKLEQDSCKDLLKAIPPLRASGDHQTMVPLLPLLRQRGVNSETLRALVDVARHLIGRHEALDLAFSIWHKQDEAIAHALKTLQENDAAALPTAIAVLQWQLQACTSKLPSIPLPYAPYPVIRDFAPLRRSATDGAKAAIIEQLNASSHVITTNIEGLQQIGGWLAMEAEPFLASIADERWKGDDPRLHHCLAEIATYLQFELAQLLLDDGAFRAAFAAPETLQEQAPILAKLAAKAAELRALRQRPAISAAQLAAAADPDDPVIELAVKIGGLGIRAADLSATFGFAAGQGFEQFAAAGLTAEHLVGITNKAQFIQFWKQSTGSTGSTGLRL